MRDTELCLCAWPSDASPIARLTPQLYVSIFSSLARFSPPPEGAPHFPLIEVSRVAPVLTFSLGAPFWVKMTRVTGSLRLSGGSHRFLVSDCVLRPTLGACGRLTLYMPTHRGDPLVFPLRLLSLGGGRANAELDLRVLAGAGVLCYVEANCDDVIYIEFPRDAPPGQLLLQSDDRRAWCAISPESAFLEYWARCAEPEQPQRYRIMDSAMQRLDEMIHASGHMVTPPPSPLPERYARHDPSGGLSDHYARFRKMRRLVPRSATCFALDGHTLITARRGPSLLLFMSDSRVPLAQFEFDDTLLLLMPPDDDTPLNQFDCIL